MFGWESLAAVWASRSKRAISSRLLLLRNLSATQRRRSVSHADQTSPIPPAPIAWTFTNLPTWLAGTSAARATSAGSVTWEEEDGALLSGLGEMRRVASSCWGER